MTTHPSALPSQQRGLTMLGWLIMLFVVGVFSIVAIKMIPVYSDYGTIKATINELVEDSHTNLMSTDEIQDSLAKRFDINAVSGLKASDLTIVKTDGELKIGLDYKVEKHLFYNVSVVMHFQHTFDKTLTNQ